MADEAPAPSAAELQATRDALGVQISALDLGKIDAYGLLVADPATTIG